MELSGKLRDAIVGARDASETGGETHEKVITRGDDGLGWKWS